MVGKSAKYIGIIKDIVMLRGASISRKDRHGEEGRSVWSVYSKVTLL